MHPISKGDGGSPARRARHSCPGIRALARAAVVPVVIAAGLAVSPTARAAATHGALHAAIQRHAPAKRPRHGNARPRRAAHGTPVSARSHAAARRLMPVRPKSSAPESEPKPELARGAGAKAQRAVQFALAQLGKPYVWGGDGPGGYDCSGLTSQAWRAAGVSIPRRSQDQATAGVGVPPAQARPGDLVIFCTNHSHVGLYVGGGKVVVSSHPGTSIQVMPVAWMPVSVVRRVG
jgi:peptidoglycan DL-endopeptidase CwlO